MSDFAEAAKAGGKSMTFFGVIAIILGILSMMMPGLTGVSVIYLLGMIVLGAGIVRLIWAFQAGSLGRGLLMFAVGLLTLLARVRSAGPPAVRLRRPDRHAGFLLHPRRHRRVGCRDQAPPGEWLGLAVLGRNRFDLARPDDLAPVSAVRRVGHRHPAGHQAVFHRADHAHGRFGGTFDNQKVSKKNITI